MLSRALCRFASFDLKGVAPQDRGRALDLQVRHWSPFERIATYVLWQGERALVWAWNAEAVETAMALEGVRPDRARVVPETLLRARPEQGVQLVNCLEGYEGQAWRDGELVASRWWGEIPSTVQWLNFQKDAAVAPEQQSVQVPEPVNAPLESTAWGKSQSLDASGMEGFRRERFIVATVGFALLTATFWYGAQVFKLRAATAQRLAELRELDRRAEPLLAARAEALEALSRVRALQEAMEHHPDQAALMAKVAELLPRDGTHVRLWEYVDGKLKIEIAAPAALVSSDWIKRFEEISPFHNVQAMPSGDAARLTLTMEAGRASRERLATSPGNPIR